MASIATRLDDNAPGEFYVDRSCIDCAVCRWVAPGVFAEASDHSYVARQPRDDAQRLRAAMALVACPTASIGTVSKIDVGSAVSRFPEVIDQNVLFCGYTSEDSFGAASYLILRPEGNVLVDSPRAAGPLLARLEQLGGVETMFLTHRDDVADHERFHRRFGCRRGMHVDDVSGTTRGVETKIEGRMPVALAHDLVMIPTPGHTRGHAVLLHRDKYLFTGDHLAYSPGAGQLVAFHDACWYSWDEQIRSMRGLLDQTFEWVLPGHGWRYRAASAAAMRDEVEQCLNRMHARSK